MKRIKEMNLQELADEMNVYTNMFPHIGLVVDRIRELNEIAERQNRMNKFLSGESDLNGYWFGEVPPNEKPYWWRKHLENLG